MMKKFFLFSFTLVLCSFFSLAALEKQAVKQSVTLTDRQLCDLEMIMTGAFAPLEGFLGREDYNSVVSNLRLKDGTVWPMPVNLDVDEGVASELENGDEIELRDQDGTLLATMTVTDVWKPNKKLEAFMVFKTLDTTHPAVDYLFGQVKDYYVGGKIHPIQRPVHFEFEDLRMTPEEMKAYIKKNNIQNVLGFQTRNPMHQAHVTLTRLGAEKADAHLLLQPVVGKTKPGDIDPYTRVRCYRKVLKHYPEKSVTLCVLPLAMRMGGPREALWHSIIRRNYGCTHFVVGRDHAGPGKDRNGNDFYGPYDAQNLVAKYADEVGIKMVPFQEVVYVKNEDRYLPEDQLEPHHEILRISGTELRRRLNEGREIPEWFSYPEVISELRKAQPLPKDQGITLFMTGLSGAGKSTIAHALNAKLHEVQSRKITILDGDIIRQNLSRGLGFSREDRSANVRRVGFVASEITKHGGIAVAALIAPYEEDRAYNRKIISENGNYIEIFVSTPLGVCEERDPKGLYAKVRLGEIKNFTGVDDPYETPKNPEVVIDTSKMTIHESVDKIINYLKENRLI